MYCGSKNAGVVIPGMKTSLSVYVSLSGCWTLQVTLRLRDNKDKSLLSSCGKCKEPLWGVYLVKGIQTCAPQAPCGPHTTREGSSLWLLKKLTEDFANFATTCTAKFAMSSKHGFRYWCVCSFVCSNFPSFPSSPEDSDLDALLLSPPRLIGSISVLYNRTASMRKSLGSIRTLWEEDMRASISDELWFKTLSVGKAFSVNLSTVSSTPRSV